MRENSTGWVLSLENRLWDGVWRAWCILGSVLGINTWREGRERRRSGERKKLSCDVGLMIDLTSSWEAHGSLELSWVKLIRSGPCAPASINHWMEVTISSLRPMQSLRYEWLKSTSFGFQSSVYKCLLDISFPSQNWGKVCEPGVRTERVRWWRRL